MWSSGYVYCFCALVSRAIIVVSITKRRSRVAVPNYIIRYGTQMDQLPKRVDKQQQSADDVRGRGSKSHWAPWRTGYRVCVCVCVYAVAVGGRAGQRESRTRSAVDGDCRAVWAGGCGGVRGNGSALFSFVVLRIITDESILSRAALMSRFFHDRRRKRDNRFTTVMITNT